jgi:predicted nucleic acid-binding protein
VIALISESTNFLFDTYAWIEYFLGSKEGEIVKELLEKENISTSVISIAELSDKYYREGLIKEWDKRYSYIINKSNILQISLEIAKNVGLSKWKFRKKNKSVGIADSIIFETAKQHNLIIVTGDLHFKDIDNLFFLG